ncbi:hypothetical protein BDV29DRAFT_179082 [Aspergillus leporis]|uniref:Uncharacterized protein n=1 Tax=Aspergillus leporis TaxID=41062 RepID=A0A5N5WSM6_9EURO|nr:hypothetical protein BDV29DRAFT_179082 [Aspergillus leporis]
MVRHVQHVASIIGNICVSYYFWVIVANLIVISTKSVSRRKYISRRQVQVQRLVYFHKRWSLRSDHSYKRRRLIAGLAAHEWNSNKNRRLKPINTMTVVPKNQTAGAMVSRSGAF